jgi:hypothetical protein
MDSNINKIAHFFHRPAFREFQQTLIQATSLPIHAKGKFHYGKVWLNESFIGEISNIKLRKEYPGLIWALSCLEHPERERNKLEFSFAIPLRFIKVIDVEVEEDKDNYWIIFIADKYVSNFEKIDRERLADYTKIAFNNDEIPYPGSEKGFVHVGPSQEIGMRETFSFEALYPLLSEIPSGTTSSGKEPEIKSYPLVKLYDVSREKPNDAGLYELEIDKRYTIPYIVWQDTKYRSRGITINKKQLVGRPIKDTISEKIQEGQEQITFEMEFSDIKVSIPLFIQARKPWYKRKFVPLIALCLFSIAAFFGYPLITSSGLSEPKAILLAALTVLVLEKLFETFQTK